MRENDQDRSKRLAQRHLAFEVLSVVHGEREAKAAESRSKAIFGSIDSETAATGIPDAIKFKPAMVKSEIPQRSSSDWTSAVNKYAPHVTSANRPQTNMTLPRSLVVNQPIARVLYAAKLVSSRSEGHRVVVERGAYIGSLPGQMGGMGDKLEFNRIVTWNAAETEKFIIDGSLLILRVGKWNVRIIKIVSDSEFEKEGGDAPGWGEFKEGQQAFRDEEAAKAAEKKQEENHRVMRDRAAKEKVNGEAKRRDQGESNYSGVEAEYRKRGEERTRWNASRSYEQEREWTQWSASKSHEQGREQIQWKAGRA